jgi:hypothetical protein
VKTLVRIVSKLVKKLTKLLTREVEEAEPAPGVLTDLDKKLGAEIQKRQTLEGKPVDTRQGGPNMPRYQPCSRCHRGSKRVEKTAGGANYRCPNPEHGKFFVRAPGL